MSLNIKKNLLLSALIFILIFVSGCDNWYSKLSPSGMIAADFVKKMREEDFQSAYKLLNEEMKSRYNSFYSLEGEWRLYEAIFGQYLSIEKPKSSVLEEGKEIYKFPITCAKGKFTLGITVQNDLICELKILDKKLFSSFDSILYPDLNLKSHQDHFFDLY